MGKHLRVVPYTYLPAGVPMSANFMTQQHAGIGARHRPTYLALSRTHGPLAQCSAADLSRGRSAKGVGFQAS
jgi:hypothetical protein